MESVKIFLAPVGNSSRWFRLFDSSQKTSNSTVLFKKVPSNFNIESFVLVNTIDEADFVAVPESIKTFGPQEQKHILHLRKKIEGTNKKILVFLTGDYCHNVHIPFPDVIVFKASEYRGTYKENEVIFPPFVEDLAETKGISLRAKASKPMVSFCGYAGYSNIATAIKSVLIHFFLTLVGKTVHKRGIFFRKKAMKVLEKDSRINTNFIIRNFFSGNARSIPIDKDKVRSEYVDSIFESDFVLCPKGDGNFSTRFYETLSFGRIPILIDTDMILPLEAEIDYSKFILRVPYKQLNQVGEYVSRFYSTITDEEFLRMQKSAREAFETRLRFDAYFNQILPVLKIKELEGKHGIVQKS